ncbi:MAG: response regulator [Desulfobacteraceae bacterium]
MMAKKVLIIDDEPHIRQLLNYELSERGFDVFECEDTHSVMHTIDLINPHAIILDIKLEDDVSGLDILQQIRDKDGHIPIILHTSYQEYNTDERANSATFYIVKSFDLSKVAETLEKLF